MTRATGKKPGRQKTDPSEKYSSGVVSFTPQVMAILNTWQKAMGKGTRSMCIGMAIQHADRSGIFDPERWQAQGAQQDRQTQQAPLTAESLEAMVKNAIPHIMARVMAAGVKPPPEGGLSFDGAEASGSDSLQREPRPNPHAARRCPSQESDFLSCP